MTRSSSPLNTPVNVIAPAETMVLNFVFSIGFGAVYAFLAEAFPTSVRSSGLAILYALGVTIFGGTTQFVVAWLIDLTKDPMVPAAAGPARRGRARTSRVSSRPRLTLPPWHVTVKMN
jgi:hypothetical protein